MVFSLGNIITLGIVLLILVIYRQMDRNNRSLDRIRRYSERVQEDINRFVDDKTVKLKNFVVELEVHQQTSREILKRITDGEVGLGERAEGIQRITDRIDEYDAAIGNLMDLTTKVDENMKRLREESSFVDSIGKKLKDLQARLNGLEKRLPVLVDEFAGLNSRDLEGLRRESLEEIERRTGELGDDIRGAFQEVENFTHRMEDVEARWEKMDGELLAKVEEGHREILDRSAREGEEMRLSFQRSMQETVDKLQGHQEKLRQEETSLETAFEEKFTLLQERTESLENSLTANLEKAARRGRELEDETFRELKTYITDRSRELEKDMEVLIQEERAKIAASSRDLDSNLRDIEARTAQWQGAISGKFTEEIEEFNRRLDEESARIASRFDEEANALGQRIDGKIETLETHLQRESSSIKDRFAEFAQGIEGRLGDVDGSVETEQSRRREELSLFIVNIKEELSSMQTSSGKALKEMEERAGRGFQELERQISNYEEEINYRISRIEKVGDEVAALDENLRQSIDRMMLGVREEFSQARKELLGHIEGQNTEVFRRVEAVKQHMSALEKELEELKAKAYDNANAKLQIFEDDFVKDLRDREDAVRRQFADWQEGLSLKLEEMGGEHGGQREQLAKELGDILQDRLTELQNKTFRQYEKYENQVTSYQEGINERIGLSERSLEGLEENLRRQIQDIRQNSRGEFENEFIAHKADMEATLRRWEREWEMGLKEQEEKMAQGLRELAAAMESTNSGVAVQHTEVSHRLEEIGAEVEERYNRLQAESKAMAASINETFLEQRNTFETSHLELQKRSKDLEIAIDQKLRDFQRIASAVREKVEEVQKRLFGKVGEHHRVLMVNIQEIDKQQKNFIAQTKIFDRADSLKLALQEQVEDLKVEIAQVTAQGKEVKEAERKFLGIKKMNDEVSSKLSRFLAEKRRIEEMEGNFKKLINLSQSIDIKLDQVTASHDSLQEVQMHIRSLEELEGRVLQKYERLEKKGNILDSTTENVDRNFQKLQNLETDIEEVEKGFLALVPQVSDVDRQVKIISNEREKAAEAAKLLGGLDKMLGDIEERMERMQKARKWLANTETRLEEVNREAQEQVKLLGSLVKEGGLAKKDKDTPQGARDVVTKLARQGWTMEEIARATKLSRGEVELILELRK